MRWSDVVSHNAHNVKILSSILSSATKVCNKCGTEEGLFCKDRPTCVACRTTYHKSWQAKNSKQYSLYHRKYRNRRLTTDPAYKLRSNISKIIWQALKGNKNGRSIVKYIAYSFEELKNHIESKFEFWMTWENWGKYIKKTWDDNNSLTWSWQLDHIIPQSDLLYISMEDDNFKKCWALSNLRPLSAKQNLLDGVSKIRHIKLD